MKINDGVISKNKSNTLKVIAIIFMVILHTFAFPSRIENVQYISLYTFKDGRTIEQIIATFGGICVPMFLFLSGYGLYVVYKEKVTYKSMLKRLLNLYKNYWVIMFIFIPIGLVIGKYRFSLRELILNTLAIGNSYNAEWWFLRLYICLILLYPVILKTINKYDKNFIIIVSFILNIVGFGITKISLLLNIKSFITDMLAILLGGQFVFILGIIVCKYSLFDFFNKRLNINKLKSILMLIVTSILIMLLINISVVGEIAKLILVPIFIYSMSNAISDNNVLSIFSKHSTNVWLIHSFFCYYLFQQIAFAPRCSIVIIFWILILSVGCSIIVNRILDMLNRINFKSIKKLHMV